MVSLIYKPDNSPTVPPSSPDVEPGDVVELEDGRERS
jgi:hypothetical protein